MYVCIVVHHYSTLSDFPHSVRRHLYIVCVLNTITSRSTNTVCSHFLGCFVRLGHNNNVGGREDEGCYG